MSEDYQATFEQFWINCYVKDEDIFILVCCDTVRNKVNIKHLLFWGKLKWIFVISCFEEQFVRICVLGMVNSVGRVPVCWAKGHGFKSQLHQHSGSLNNWEESAAFVYNFTCKQIDFLVRTKDSRSHLTALSLMWFLWEPCKRTHTTVQK